MGKRTVHKITISLPEALLDVVDHLARERSLSRSGLMSALLAQEERARVHALMAEGYQELGEENRREAEEALHLTSEVVLRDG